MFLSIIGPVDNVFTSDDFEKSISIFLEQAFEGKAGDLEIWEHEIFDKPRGGKDVTRDCLERMTVRAGDAVREAAKRHRTLLDLFIKAEQAT